MIDAHLCRTPDPPRARTWRCPVCGKRWWSVPNGWSSYHEDDAAPRWWRLLHYFRRVKP